VLQFERMIPAGSRSGKAFGMCSANCPMGIRFRRCCRGEAGVIFRRTGKIMVPPEVKDISNGQLARKLVRSGFRKVVAAFV